MEKQINKTHIYSCNNKDHISAGNMENINSVIGMLELSKANTRMNKFKCFTFEIALPDEIRTNNTIYHSNILPNISINNILLQSHLYEKLQRDLFLINKTFTSTIASKIVDQIFSKPVGDFNRYIQKYYRNFNARLQILGINRFALQVWSNTGRHNFSDSYRQTTDEKHYKFVKNMNYKDNLMFHIILKVDPSRYTHKEAVVKFPSEVKNLMKRLKYNHNIISYSGLLEFHADRTKENFEYPHLHMFIEFDKGTNRDRTIRSVRKIVKNNWRMRNCGQVKLSPYDIKLIENQDYFENAALYCVFSKRIKNSKFKPQQLLPNIYDDFKSIRRHYHSNNKSSNDADIESDKCSHTKGTIRSHMKRNQFLTYGERKKIRNTKFRIYDRVRKKSWSFESELAYVSFMNIKRGLMQNKNDKIMNEYNHSIEFELNEKAMLEFLRLEMIKRTSDFMDKYRI